MVLGMRGLVALGVVAVVPCLGFGQKLDDNVHYSVYYGPTHNMDIFASSESRTGNIYSFAYGRKDPAVKLRGKEGELVWEGNYVETRTANTTVQYPSATSRGIGALASARYRWALASKLNFFADGGFGYQFIDHATVDLPLCNNTTFEIGGGIEFVSSSKSSVLLGTRLLHQSNDGRKRPNFGQNLLQVYVGYRL